MGEIYEHLPMVLVVKMEPETKIKHRTYGRRQQGITPEALAKFKETLVQRRETPKMEMWLVVAFRARFLKSTIIPILKFE